MGGPIQRVELSNLNYSSRHNEHAETAHLPVPGGSKRGVHRGLGRVPHHEGSRSFEGTVSPSRARRSQTQPGEAIRPTEVYWVDSRTSATASTWERHRDALCVSTARTT